MSHTAVCDLYICIQFGSHISSLARSFSRSRSRARSLFRDSTTVRDSCTYILSLSRARSRFLSLALSLSLPLAAASGKNDESLHPHNCIELLEVLSLSLALSRSLSRALSLVAARGTRDVSQRDSNICIQSLTHIYVYSIAPSPPFLPLSLVHGSTWCKQRAPAPSQLH